MSTHLLASCRRNLLPDLVTDLQVIGDLSEEEVSKLSLTQIEKLARENAAFAHRAEALMPMQQRKLISIQANIFLAAQDLVKPEFLQRHAFELAKNPENRRLFLHKNCVEHVIKRAVQDKDMYVRALQALSLSKVSGLFHRILLCNSSMMHVVDLSDVLVNLCHFEESYEANLKSFFEIYGLRKVPKETLAKILCKVADFKNPRLFADLYRPSLFESLSLNDQQKLAIAALSISNHPLCDHFFSLVDLRLFSHTQIMSCLTLSALNNHAKYFQMFLNTQQFQDSEQIKKCAWLQSAKLSDPRLFHKLLTHELILAVSTDDLAHLLKFATSSFREDVVAFVLEHEKFCELDEIHLGEVMIQAGKVENLHLLGRLFDMQRYGDIEVSCVDKAFYEGVVKRGNRDILKLFHDKHILSSVRTEDVFQALKTFGIKDDVEAYHLFQAPEILAAFSEKIALGEIIGSLESFVEHDACRVVSSVLNTPFVALVPFSIIQRLFDRTLENRKLATLRVILNSSQAVQLNPLSIFEAIKRQVELQQLAFFDASAVELLRALPKKFTHLSLLQKLDIIKKLSNLAIMQDRATVLEQALSLTEFERLDQQYIDIIASYVEKNTKKNCIHVMIGSNFFHKIPSNIVIKTLERALQNNQVDTVTRLIAAAVKHKIFYEWFFSKENFCKIVEDSASNYSEEILEVLLNCQGLFLLSQDLLESLANKEGLAERKKALLQKAFTDRN